MSAPVAVLWGNKTSAILCQHSVLFFTFPLAQDRKSFSYSLPGPDRSFRLLCTLSTWFNPLWNRRNRPRAQTETHSSQGRRNSVGAHVQYSFCPSSSEEDFYCCEDRKASSRRSQRHCLSTEWYLPDSFCRVNFLKPHVPFCVLVWQYCA